MCFEINITPDYGVQADVQLTIDTTNADDIDASIDAFEAHYAEDWEVIAECKNFQNKIQQFLYLLSNLHIIRTDLNTINHT